MSKHAWDNCWSSSTRLGLSVGHAVRDLRVCKVLPSCVRASACGRPIHSNIDLTVASSIAHYEHRPKSVQGMPSPLRSCRTAPRRSGIQVRSTVRSSRLYKSYIQSLHESFLKSIVLNRHYLIWSFIQSCLLHDGSNIENTASSLTHIHHCSCS